MLNSSPMGHAMNHPRPRLSELTSQELTRRAVEYRRMAVTAHGPATISALNMLAARYAMLAAKREIEETSARRVATDLGQSEVDKLARLAEQAAASVADPLRALADIIRMFAASEADPYVLMGVLIEGVVHTLRATIPDERHQNCGPALVKILIDRLQANGIPMVG